MEQELGFSAVCFWILLYRNSSGKTSTEEGLLQLEDALWSASPISLSREKGGQHRKSKVLHEEPWDAVANTYQIKSLSFPKLGSGWRADITFLQRHPGMLCTPQPCVLLN